MANRGRLIAKTAATLGLDTTAGSDELTLLREWAQEGVHDVLIRTHCRVELGDLTFQANVSDYRVDQAVLALDEETLTSATYNLELVTPGEIYRKRLAASPSPDGTVTSLAIEGDLMLVYPTPTTASTIRYLYVARPTAMVDDNSDPSSSTYGGIPVELHLCIEHYMLWRGSIYDGTRVPLTPKDYLELYLQMCKDGRKATRHKAMRGLYPTKHGYPDRRYVGRRNDIYP